MSDPCFWRAPGLPYLEIRRVADGRNVCYARHSHPQWSMGLILEGQSGYRIQKLKGEGDGEHYHIIGQGSLVFMNPDQIHACTALDEQPWSYAMFYLDCDWLAQLSYRLGLQQDTLWQDIPVNLLEDPNLFARVSALTERLFASGSDADIAVIEADIEQVFAEVLQVLAECAEGVSVAARPEPVADAVAAIARQLDQNPEQRLSLEQMSRAAGITPTQLIRAFKRYYGFTPHAYQVNRRIQLGQKALKQGEAIAQAALSAGFADQPHFQRVFKKLLQATPRQYRGL